MPLAEEEVSGIALFIPEIYDIVWSLVVLIVIAVAFYVVIMPKFQAVFDERAARIEGGIAKAEQAQREAEDTKRKYEEQLSQARVEASKIHRRRSFPCRVRSGTDHRQRAASHRIAAAAGDGQP